MDRHIRQWFDTLQRQKEAVLLGVSTWPAERLRFRPQPTAWSTLNVLDHLLKTEQGVFDAVGKSLPGGHPVTWKDRFGEWMVIGVMRSPIRVKVPASAQTVLPGETSDLPMITKQWQETREQAAQLLASLSPGQLRCGLFQHPIAGWMTMLQTVRFLSAHLQHHGYQLNRLKRATGEL